MSILGTQGIFFDPHRHVYTTLAGEVLPSNTEILEGMGFVNYSFVAPDKLAAAAEIGSDVASATALLDRGRPWKAQFSHVAGWVAGWQKFKKDFKFKPELIEEPLFDPYYMVATTPDRHGESIHGNITAQIKTSVGVSDWVGLQLAFEERCIAIAKGDPPIVTSSDRRFAIELRPNGTYKPTRFPSEFDIRVFLAAATVFLWRRKHERTAARPIANSPQGGSSSPARIPRANRRGVRAAR